MLAGSTPVLVHNCAAPAPKRGIFARIKSAIQGTPPPSFEPNATVGDLQGFGHDMIDDDGNWTPGPLKGGIVGSRSDAELIDSTLNPTLYGDEYTQPITVNENDNYLVDGNHRAAELLSRAANPRSEITLGTPIYIRGFTGGKSG